MRMAELSRESGLPVATIKFYLREGLLPPGERTSPNQARYGDEHVRRLRLVRALMEVGGLTVAQTGAVLQAMAEGPLSALATAQDAMADPDADEPEQADPWVEERFTELLERTGWEVGRDSAAARRVRDLLVTGREVGGIDFVHDWAEYAEYADAIARRDIAWTAAQPNVEDTVSGAVVGTVLGAAYLNGLRMLAHQHHSAQRWPDAFREGD